MKTTHPVLPKDDLRKLLRAMELRMQNTLLEPSPHDLTRDVKDGLWVVQELQREMGFVAREAST